MIVDFHTHVFPPAMIAAREELSRRDATFGEMYGGAKAKMATAEDLLRSMDAAGIDVSVVLGFAWRDGAECRRQNDYILEAAGRSGGRLVPFCGLSSAPDADPGAEASRCAALGARGVGELRLDTAAAADADARTRREIGDVARRNRLIALVHASEPVGHLYAGKSGGRIHDLVEFAGEHPDVVLIAAHWGGGLPFYTLMPEVEGALKNTYFDTAASRLLYSPPVYRAVVDRVGVRRVLFGSDFPLVTQEAARREAEGAGLTTEEAGLILGGNAERLLGL